MQKLIFSLLWPALLAFAAIGQETKRVLVLGIAQDGGYPQLGCARECCAPAWKKPGHQRFITSLAITDPDKKKWWLVEAAPDIREQLHLFQQKTGGLYPYLPEGIFITHAHIGHYAGLMQLGREVMNTSAMPVYVLPGLKTFLENNGPWSQLVRLKNIVLQLPGPDGIFQTTGSLRMEAFSVPHRDEFSETAGFRWMTGNTRYLFIPDIDKWQKWNRSVTAEVARCDIAFLDATFSQVSELRNRTMAEVPHPLVPETIQLFRDKDPASAEKIRFIHLNHTNELLWNRQSRLKLRQQGFQVAGQGQFY